MQYFSSTNVCTDKWLWASRCNKVAPAGSNFLKPFPTTFNFIFSIIFHVRLYCFNLFKTLKISNIIYILANICFPTIILFHFFFPIIHPQSCPFGCNSSTCRLRAAIAKIGCNSSTCSLRAAIAKLEAHTPFVTDPIYAICNHLDHSPVLNHLLCSNWNRMRIELCHGCRFILIALCSQSPVSFLLFMGSWNFSLAIRSDSGNSL